MYKAIFFDLDGTLTESGEGITKSVQYALEKLGVSAPELEPLKVFVGPPLLEQFMKYAGFDKETAQKGIEYYRERYSEKGMYENTVYPGVENALAELKRRGYRLAVASAKPTFYVTQIMDHFNLSRYFEVIAGTDLNGPKVTKSQVIEEALERMSLSDHRDQVIMVGDREHDILGARRCGIQCVAVSYGYGSREELEEEIDHCIHKFMEDGTTMQKYQIFIMGLITEIFRFCTNNQLDIEEFYGEKSAVFEKCMQMESPEELERWLLEIGEKLQETVQQERQATTKSFASKAVEYVQEHYSDRNITIESVCKELGVSAAYFSTIFKKETGKTFISFLTDYRMEKAVELLMTTNDKTYIIAEKVGYADPNYFSYAFKKQYSMSPSKYRSANSNG